MCVCVCVSLYRATHGCQRPPPLWLPHPETPPGGQVLAAAELRATPVWPCSLCPRYRRAQAGWPGSAAERGLSVRFFSRASVRNRLPGPGGPSCRSRTGALRLRPVVCRTHCAPPHGDLPHLVALPSCGMDAFDESGRGPEDVAVCGWLVE